MREEVKVRKQKTVEEEVQCFRCWRIGHYKWECPNIKMEKERRSKKVAYAISLQKMQQEKRPACSLWRKAQEHSVHGECPQEVQHWSREDGQPNGRL